MKRLRSLMVSMTTIMEEIIGKALTNSTISDWRIWNIKKSLLLGEYARINKSFHPNLINKANRQTIEAFRKNIWKIGKKVLK